MPTVTSDLNNLGDNGPKMPMGPGKPLGVDLLEFLVVLTDQTEERFLV